MARKTTKIGLELVKQYDLMRKLCEEYLVLNATRKPEELAEHVLKYTPEYVEVLMEGMRRMLETVLMEQNCYHGFHYVGPKGEHLLWSGVYERVTLHPDFREWRISYYTK